MALGGVKVPGTKGKITISTSALAMVTDGASQEVVGHIVGSSYRWTQDEHSADTYDDTGNVKKVQGGMSQVRGSIEGFLDLTHVFDSLPFTTYYNVGGQIEIYEDVSGAVGAQLALQCDVIFPTLNIRRDRGGTGTFSADFVNSGDDVYHKGRPAP